VPSIQAHIHHSSAQVRRAVIRSLGQTADASSIPLIEPFLSDPDRAFRREAIIALGKFGDPAVLPRIESAAGGDAELLRLVDEAHRRIDAIRKGTPEALVDALIETAEYEDLMANFIAVREVLQKMVADRLGSDLAREHATRLLSLRRTRTASPFFRLRLLPGNDVREVRLECIRGLGRTRFRSAVPQLIAELDSPDPEIQEAAVIALGEIGHPAAFQPLINLWPRGNHALLSYIRTALRRICPSPGESVLAQLLGAGSQPEGFDLYCIDDEFELTAGLPRETLHAELESADKGARRDATLLLAVFGSAADRSAMLDRSLLDLDPEIRDLASRALQRFTNLFGLG